MSDSEQKTAYLVLGEQTYELQKRLTIGSSEKMDVCIKGQGLAPKHCMFRVQNNVVSLMDLGSGSGTLVEQKKVEAGRQILITEDDEIQIGDCFGKIMFKAVEAAEPEEDNILSLDPEDLGGVEDSTPQEIEAPAAGDDLPGLELAEDSFLKIEQEVDRQQNVDEYSQPDQEIFEISESPKAPNDGYELSFGSIERKEKTGPIGTVLTKLNLGMAQLREKFKLGGASSEPEPETTSEQSTDPNYERPDIEEEDVDPEVLNEQTVILPAEDGSIPVREQLRQIEEQKRADTKGVLQEVRKGGAKSSKMKVVAVPKVAGVNFRLLGLLVDWFFVSTLLQFPVLAPLKKIAETMATKVPLVDIFNDLGLLQLISENLPGDFSEVSPEEFIEIHLATLVALFIFRAAATLCLGVSLGQYLFGLRAPGGIIFKRLAGFFRVCLEPILGPFLVFDLPCFIKRPTVKEIVSRTGLQWDNKPAAFLSLVLLCPLILLYLFRGQVVTYVPSLKETFVTKIDSIKYTELAEKSKPVSSSYFRFKTTFKNYDRYWLFPSFKVDRAGAKSLISPMLFVYQPESGWEAEFSVHRDFKMKGLTQSLGDTIEWLDENEINAVLKEGKYRGFSSEVDPKYRTYVETFWRRSISLHWKNIFHELPLAKTGLVSYYLSKKYFWEYLNIDQEMDIKQLNFKNLDMFLFSAHKEESPLPLKHGYLLPLTGGTSRIYAFNWSKRRTSDQETLKFLYDLFYEADFSFMNHKALKDEGLNIISALDTFAKLKSPLEDRQKAGELILNYYAETLKTVQATERHRKAKKRLIEELNKLKVVLDLTARKHPEWLKTAKDDIDLIKEKFGQQKMKAPKDPNADI